MKQVVQLVGYWEHISINSTWFHHYHHLVMTPARATLTLCRHSSSSFIVSARAKSRIFTELLYIGSSWSSCFCSAMWGVHWKTSLMISSLLLQQCPACLVCLTLIVFLMGGRWPYSCCFEACCLQDLFNIARGILV